MKKGSIIIILFLSFIVFPLNSSAISVTFGDELDELNALYDKKNKEDTEKALSEAEYKRLQDEILAIEKDIEKLSNEIQEATKKIEEYEVKIEDKKEETNDILVFLQLSNGEKSYLEYIFKAKSFTDFIHRVSIVEQLGKYNKEQIAEMNDLIKKNNELKKQNAENIEKQKAKKEESKIKMAEVGSKISDLIEGQADTSARITQKEAEIDALRNAGCKNRDDLLSVCAGFLYDTRFIKPTTYGMVTSEYGWRWHPTLGYYRLHSGIDLGVSEGTEVYPVANGKIIGKIYYSSCGGNQLYISHIINGQYYTSVYMHLLSFNENYQVGDLVTSNTLVAYSGGGSTASSNGGYDTCTTGAHLHLTLSYGHTTSLNSTFNPREVLSFPGEYAGWWWSRY